MALLLRHRQLTALAAVSLSLACALPATASAATTIPAAPATQFNTTPDCPVSASDPVCAWNLPADVDNIFGTADYGQCPYWAAEKYPAIVLGELAADPLGEDWDGGAWLEHAVEEGLGASTTPASGDLAVWQPEGGDTTGHIAYVEAVVGNAIIVSQMDGDSSAPFPADQGSTEWISGSDLAYFEATYGLQFVATGDASSTPLADVAQPAAPTAASTTTTTAAPTVSKPVSVKKAVKQAVKKSTVKRPSHKHHYKHKATRAKRKTTESKRRAATSKRTAAQPQPKA
jgi:surface antigen